MGTLLGLGLAALPLSLAGIFVCAMIVGSLEMELRVHRLPSLVSGTAQKPDGIYPASGISRITNSDQWLNFVHGTKRPVGTAYVFVQMPRNLPHPIDISD